MLEVLIAPTLKLPNGLNLTFPLGSRVRELLISKSLRRYFIDLPKQGFIGIDCRQNIDGKTSCVFSVSGLDPHYIQDFIGLSYGHTSKSKK